MNYSIEENIETDKYTLTPNGIEIIFQKLSSEKIPAKKIIETNINLQYSGTKLNSYYTLSDCYHNFSYFLILNPPFTLDKDVIINIKQISYIYDSEKQFFYFIINSYNISAKPLYQIYPYTTLFNVNKYLNIFIYTKKRQIDYLKYNVLNNLDSLPKKFSFYVRVISKVTLTSFTKNKDNTHNGNFFYFDVVDINNDTVRVTATYSNANFYYNKIKINNIYSISGNFYLHELTRYQEHNKENPLYKYYKEIKAPNKEIYLGNDSKVTEMNSEDSNLIEIDENKFLEFYNIGNVLKLNNSFVDLVNTIGIVVKAAKCYKVTYAIRKIKLLDDSGFIIEANIWNQYTLFPIKLGDILMIKNIQVKKNYEGINYLTTVDETNIILNPDIENKDTLKKIYEKYFEESESIKKYSSKKCNKKNKSENKNKINIFKYINLINGSFAFIKELTDKENQKKNSSIKLVYGYINKLIYENFDDIIICKCLNCSKILKQKGILWVCSNCKKNYICPNYAFKDLILNVIDSSWNINININSKIIKEIFGITPDKIKKIEEIKSFANKIKYKQCCFYTLNNYDINGNLIVEDFNLVTQDKIKEQNLIEIKNYFKISP